MPLWRVYHPNGALDDLDDRRALAKDITDLYVRAGLPAFYVAVVYVNTGTGGIFRGYEQQPSATKPPFIRLVFDHIARGFEAGRSARKLQFFETVNGILGKHIGARGWEWEIHGEDTEITMGRMQGQELPPEDSDVYAEWVKQDRPVPYEWQSEWTRE